jgi:hypothetical protein
MLWYKLAREEYLLPFWWFVFVSVVLVLFAVPGSITCRGCGVGADGAHSVYVTSVEDRDFLTWDSTLVHCKSSTESTQEEAYCVDDPGVRAKLEAACRARRPVVIRFHNDFIFWRWQCNGGESIIVGVEEP